MTNNVLLTIESTVRYILHIVIAVYSALILQTVHTLTYAYVHISRYVNYLDIFLR